MFTDRLSRLAGSIGATDQAGLNVRAYFDEAVKSLHDQLADRESLLKSHQDIVNSLQEQLNTCNVRVAHEEAQKVAAHGEASGLKEQNAELESKVSALQKKISPAENAQFQLNEAKADLEKTRIALTSARTDLESKAEALDALKTANASLTDQMKALQNRLDAIPNPIGHVEIEQEEQLARLIQEAEERVRKEMADHIDVFETQLKTKANNEVKRLTSERNRIEKQLKPLQEELASSKHLITQLQTDNSASPNALKQELERTEKHNHSLQSEIETLQSSLGDLKAELTAGQGVQDKLSNLSAQLHVEEIKLKQTMEHNAELLQQVSHLGQAEEAMVLAKEQAQADIANLRKENDNLVDVMQKALEEAKGTAERATSGLEHYKESCRKSIDDASEKANRKVHALQNSLSEAQADLKREKEEGEKFRNAVEERWLQEQQSFDENLAASNKKVAEAELRASEAEASIERRLRQEIQTAMDEQNATLQEQLEYTQARAEAAEEKMLSQQRPPSDNSETFSCFNSQYMRDGVTLSAGIKSVVPPKPRKKADRNKHTAAEVEVDPAPEEIRLHSYRMNSANGRTFDKGPVVEESQFAEGAVEHTGGEVFVPATSDPEQSSFLSTSTHEGLLLHHESSQALPHTVPETQFEDTLPSFAAVNRNLNPTHAAMPLPLLTSTSTSPKPGTNVIAGIEESILNSFTIYEDSHEHEQNSQSQYPHHEAHVRTSEPWSQEEKVKYTYQKPMPQPNSASKRVHSFGHKANYRKSSGPGEQQRPETGQDRYKTPVPNTGFGDGPASRVQSSNGSSSSPAFMQMKLTNRRQSTYYTSSGSSAKRRASQSNAGYIADPRLGGRNEQAGTKRKADNDIVEGYEHERKKRLSVGTNNVEKNERRGLSQQLQYIKDLPGMNARPISSNTRMQHLAGGSSRLTRSAKKTTKSKFLSPDRHASS